jgi:hypothetical protein
VRFAAGHKPRLWVEGEGRWPIPADAVSPPRRGPVPVSDARHRSTALDAARRYHWGHGFDPQTEVVTTKLE